MIDWNVFHAWLEILGERIPIDFKGQGINAKVNSVSIDEHHSIWIRFLFLLEDGHSSALNTQVTEPPPPEEEVDDSKRATNTS